MSYNINTWRVKKLDNLRIPLASFFKHERKDWHPEKEIGEDNSLTLTCMESYITGQVEGDVLCIMEIHICGEGSGTIMSWIVEPALCDSCGELIASCVWERGDLINQIIVKNGNVEWKEIKI